MDMQLHAPDIVGYNYSCIYQSHFEKFNDQQIGLKDVIHSFLPLSQF